MLTPLRIAFCEQYVIDRNATQAALRAGYKESNAYASGNYLLNQPEVKQYIAELDAQIRERNQITKDDIIKDICEIRDRCMQRVPVMYFDKEEKEYLQKCDELGNGVWTFDAQNALKACDMLAKHIGFYEADKAPVANVNILNAPNMSDLLKIKRMLDEQ